MLPTFCYYMRSGLLAFLFISATSLSSAPPASPATPATPGVPAAPVTVTGVVFPNETNAEGNPVSVYIEVLGKGDSEVNVEYFIVNDARGKDLFKSLYSNVAVYGIVSTNATGNYMLSVQRYSILESKPEDLEEEF
jgi:hypothetical protein